MSLGGPVSWHPPHPPRSGPVCCARLLEAGGLQRAGHGASDWLALARRREARQLVVVGDSCRRSRSRETDTLKLDDLASGVHPLIGPATREIRFYTSNEPS
jgi:hypothetical protein